MKLNDSLRRALLQAAEEETPTAPHDFSEHHEQQMTALFSRKPAHHTRWMTVVLPLAACLAIVAIVGWDQHWWTPDPVNNTQPPATTTTTTQHAGEMQSYQGDFTQSAGNAPPTGSAGDNHTASASDSPNDICHFVATIRVTAVCNGWLEYTVVEDSSEQIADCHLLIKDPAAYAIGDVLLIGYSARSFSEEWLKPESIKRLEE